MKYHKNIFMYILALVKLIFYEFSNENLFLFLKKFFSKFASEISTNTIVFLFKWTHIKYN